MILPRFVLLGTLLSCGLLVGACSVETGEDVGYSEDDVRQALVITERDNNKTFSVPKGKDIRVALPANPTTGYAWKVVSTTRTFGYPDPIDGEYSTDDNPTGAIGGGGTQTFLWKTTRPNIRPSGTAHKVVLEYRRAWDDEDAPAAKTFTFKIKIKEGTVLPPPDPQDPVTLFEEHNGSTVQAKVGQDIVLRLPENPSAGYRWYVTSTNRTFGYPEKTFEGAGSNGPVGASGTAVMTWKTDGPLDKVGTHTVKLKYSRGENGAASKTFEFTVTISPADGESEFTCPPASMRTIDCQPVVPADRRKYCAPDYRAWAQQNCDVSYLY